MCCEPRWGHHLPVGFRSLSGWCMPHGHHDLTLEEEKEMLESYKRDLEDEISRVEARINKIQK